MRSLAVIGALVSCTPMSGAVRPAGADEADGPTSVECGDQVIELALGYHHSCALLASGRVTCWGDNSLGQLGTGRGMPSHSFAPVLVPSLEEVVEVRANGAATCVRRRTGEVLCWGANLHGEVDPAARISGRSAPFAEGGYDWTGEPASFSPGNIVGEPREMKALFGARSLSMGVQHGCASFDDGRVICWGNSSDGQLGPGAARDAFQIQRVGGIPPVIELVCDGDYTCGRTAKGDVWCWGGDNLAAQLGTAARSPAPRQVPGVSGALALVLTDSRACARVARGELVCWGDPGGCGEATAALPPAHATELDGSLQLARASGGCFGCVLGQDHTVACNASPYSQKEISMTDVQLVAAGDDHACVVRLDREVWCWGTNARGELGRHSSTEREPDPAPVQWPVNAVTRPCDDREVSR